MGGSIAGAPEIAAPYNFRVGMPMIRFPPFLSREYALACQAKNGPALSHRPSMFAGGTSCGERSAKRTALPKFSSCKHRSEEHTSELQSLMRISYAVFCLKK